MKSSWLSILALNRFNFGDRIIYQFVLFECKFLFSIIFFWFLPSVKRQDRFHTHAFNAISIKLFGEYSEYQLEETTGKIERKERTEIIKYFPRNCYHCIGESRKGCLTLLISGPWKSIWKEWKDGETTILHWNRK